MLLGYKTVQHVTRQNNTRVIQAQKKIVQLRDAVNNKYKATVGATQQFYNKISFYS